MWPVLSLQFNCEFFSNHAGREVELITPGARSHILIKIIVKILELYLLYFFEKYLKDFQNTFTISFHKIYKKHEIKI
jgi:hypothetical protein